MKTTILGAGAWGTALARLLCRNRTGEVVLWGRSREQLNEIQRLRRNEAYLPGIDLPPTLKVDGDLPRAVAGADLVVVAVPSRGFRDITAGLRDFSGTIVSVTKGIEYESGLTMTGILRQNCPGARCAALSGPSFADEVARDIPTAVVAASEDQQTAKAVQALFSSPVFRVYTSTDWLGVELGGALKNVIAIAAGCSDGLGFGDNSKAALVTRATVELRRLGEACGARGSTFTGLSGLGDLVATCFSRLSRNRGFGERVGRGENPKQIISHSHAVVEGYPTARSAYHLARVRSVSTPVIDEVYAMLYEGKDVRKTVSDLMVREAKPEQD